MYVHQLIFNLMFENLQKMNADNLARKQERDKLVSEIMNTLDQLDAVINFRISSPAKAEFERLCKENHSTVSRELKVFIFNSIKRGRIQT
jgi:hypothetical protein